MTLPSRYCACPGLVLTLAVMLTIGGVPHKR
jgi:hypothetical protein